MSLRPFSKGRISKKIPPGPAVTQYFEVPARHREHELAQAMQAGAPLRPWESPATLLKRKILGHRPLTW
jgi:hypothetical protein